MGFLPLPKVRLVTQRDIEQPQKVEGVASSLL